jgi:hypothetical protein
MNHIALLSLVLPSIVCLIFSISWTNFKVRESHNLRNRVFLLALAAISVSVLAYLAFVFRTGTQSVWLLRLGFWTAIAGLCLTGTGRGRSRATAFVSAALIFGIWLMYSWSPA